MVIELDNYGLCIVRFSDIFNKAYKDIVKDLFFYDKFTDLNVRNQDTKKIYYFHLIKHVTDVVMSTKTSNKIVIYYCHKDISCDFQKCRNKRSRATNKDNKDEFVTFMNRFVKNLSHIMPFRVFVGKVKMQTFIQYYNTNKGVYIETINDIRYGDKRKEVNLRKLKEFVKKYKLNYLTDQLLNNIKVKCIMYK